jgi:hypothetical protein
MTKRHPITAAEGERIAEMRSRGRSYGTIARIVGCSVGSVHWCCLKNGIEPPVPPPLRPDQYKRCPQAKRGNHVIRWFTPEEDARILALERLGLGPTAIGRELKRRPNSITGRLMTLARREERAGA